MPVANKGEESLMGLIGSKVEEKPIQISKPPMAAPNVRQSLNKPLEPGLKEYEGKSIEELEAILDGYKRGDAPVDSNDKPSLASLAKKPEPAAIK